jgi:hypothetical protein
MKREYYPEQGPFEIDPMIDNSITSMLKKHAENLSAQDQEKFDYAATDPELGQGAQIDLICWDLGNKKQFEDSTKLKALRLVRAFLRQVVNGTESERGFDYPVLNDYWASVDQKFMQLIERQARSHRGTYDGDLNYNRVTGGNGNIGHTRIATIGSLTIAKAAIVHNASPTHVYYRSFEGILPRED